MWWKEFHFFYLNGIKGELKITWHKNYNIKLILYQLVFGKFSEFSQKKDENLQKSRKNPDRCDEKNFTFSI